MNQSPPPHLNDSHMKYESARRQHSDIQSLAVNYQTNAAILTDRANNPFKQ